MRRARGGSRRGTLRSSARSWPVVSGTKEDEEEQPEGASAPGGAASDLFQRRRPQHHARAARVAGIHALVFGRAPKRSSKKTRLRRLPRKVNPCLFRWNLMWRHRRSDEVP
jgi:hypothetical protein